MILTSFGNTLPTSINNRSLHIEYEIDNLYFYIAVRDYLFLQNEKDCEGLARENSY
jgi:hypothetical protein